MTYIDGLDVAFAAEAVDMECWLVSTRVAADGLRGGTYIIEPGPPASLLALVVEAMRGGR